MATLQDLERGLIAADKAGNADDARAFAAEIRRMRTESQEMPAYEREARDPTQGMSGLQKFTAGAGKAVSDTLQGAGQMVGLTDRADVAETRRLDAPLMDSTAGKIGNFAGNVGVMAPAVLAGGLTIPTAAAVGAGMGLVQPSTSTKETVINTLAGGAGGAAGQAIGNKLASLAQSGTAKTAAINATNAPKMTTARNASNLGYVIPPDDLNAGFVTKAASGLSGKIKTAQEASARNQAVTNDLARAAIGIKNGEQITPQALNKIRTAAGNAYDAVGSAGTINPTAAYTAELDSIAAPYVKASQGFPNAKPDPVIAAIDEIRSTAFDAGSAIEKIKLLRASADKAYATGDKGTGKALKAGAEALENAIDTHLTATGAPADMLKNFRQARQLIAKTYTVQKGLNATTGDVSAGVLGKQLEKGRPLSGELRQIAEVNQAFPKATQSLKETPKATSPLDWAAGGITSAGSGSPLPMLMVGARPLARNALLSNLVQRQALQDVGPGATQRVLENRLLQLLTAPAGIQGGLAGAELAR